MRKRYNCTCCNRPILSTENICPYCGSLDARRPYRWWVLYLLGCIVVIALFKMVHFYTHNAYETLEHDKMISLFRSQEHKE